MVADQMINRPESETSPAEERVGETTMPQTSTELIRVDPSTLSTPRGCPVTCNSW